MKLNLKLSLFHMPNRPFLAKLLIVMMRKAYQPNIPLHKNASKLSMCEIHRFQMASSKN